MTEFKGHASLYPIGHVLNTATRFSFRKISNSMWEILDAGLFSGLHIAPNVATEGDSIDMDVDFIVQSFNDACGSA